MDPGFSIQNWLCITGDGRIHTVMQDVLYCTKARVQYKIPSGATSDGASTPQAIWNIIPPFGSYWKAAFLHDCAYRNTLQVLQDDGSWVRARVTKDVADLLLLEAMELLGTHEATRVEIYEGVKLGGWKSFEDDRKDNP